MEDKNTKLPSAILAACQAIELRIKGEFINNCWQMRKKKGKLPKTK